MPSFKLLVLFLCLGSSVAFAQRIDESIAAHALGPQWKQMAHSAGTIFSGTLLNVTQDANTGSVPILELQFKVNRGIAGVQSGKMLTVREWSGAWSLHRPMRKGERVLLFLYPRSRLGLTSPVNGSAGQIPLDGSGNLLSSKRFSVRQLERAIRSVREE